MGIGDLFVLPEGAILYEYLSDIVDLYESWRTVESHTFDTEHTRVVRQQDWNRVHRRVAGFRQVQIEKYSSASSSATNEDVAIDGDCSCQVVDPRNYFHYCAV